MKNQGKTFLVVWVIGAIFFSAFLGAGLIAHIIAIIFGLVAALLVDMIISIYERKVIRKKGSP